MESFVVWSVRKEIVGEDPDFTLENGARAIFLKEAQVNCHNGGPLSGCRLCVSISAFLLCLALFLASLRSLAPGHICLGRLDRRALWMTTPELPSSAGDSNSWRRSGPLKAPAVLFQLTSPWLLLFSFLFFLFCSLQWPLQNFSLLLYLPPNPCSLLRTDVVSLAWFRIESNGRGGGGWRWGDRVGDG